MPVPMMRAMSIPARTDLVQPFKLARQNGRWQGQVALVALQRFAALVGDTHDCVVDVDLAFSRDADRHCRVAGRALVDVQVECGRCLLPQPVALDVGIDLCVVTTDAEAADLMGAADTFVLAGEEVSVADLIEDDLILGLPSRVCERRDECPNKPVLEYGATDVMVEHETSKPFASLAQWRAKRH